MEDLFVVYRGVNDAGQLSMDVRVNPLISWVWVGFAMLVIGTGLGAFGRRKPSNKAKDTAQAQAKLPRAMLVRNRLRARLVRNGSRVRLKALPRRRPMPRPKP